MISSKIVHCLNVLGLVKKEQRDSLFVVKVQAVE